jgi:hypothetical protein
MKERNERPLIDLIVDGISDPRNVPALLALADTLHCRCFFRDRHDLRGKLAETPLVDWVIDAPPLEQLADQYDLLLAVENHAKARSIFEYRPPRGKRLAMIVGNERKGLDRKISRMADVMLEIPMRPRHGISLNVASAASAALYQLLGAGEAGRHKRTRGLHRPELIFWEPHDAADLGTSLRTAYALGWDSAQVVDTFRVWFGADRETIAQGRGAARRHKTSIRVRPLNPTAPTEQVDVAVLVASGIAGTPVRRLRLPERGSCALVFSDSPVSAESLTSMARECWPVTLEDEPATPRDAPLRIFSAITLTEVAQVVR